ncbi:MAG: hypothetical protein KY476_17890 [Planctomycetes bacterium]|nr:hypothetical protein [Planctomycetota bacterium]
MKLSPEDWVDGFQTQAVCRNILIDLTSGAVANEPLREARVEWTLAPAP